MIPGDPGKTDVPEEPESLAVLGTSLDPVGAFESPDDVEDPEPLSTGRSVASDGQGDLRAVPRPEQTGG